MTMILNINGKRATTLLRTNIKSSNIFKSHAESEYEKLKKKEHKELIEEINRRSLQDYGV